MDIKEILDFLELPETAGDDLIRDRALEKKDFFLKLQASAPNSFLKSVHARNVEKITQVLNVIAKSAQTSGHNDKAQKPVAQSEKTNNKRIQPGVQESHCAYLIRHTEGMPVISYGLQPGRNLLGRLVSFAGYHAISLENDVYISRQHAVIEISLTGEQVYFIADGLDKPSKNGIYINGNPHRITKKTRFYHNDTIQVGETKLQLKVAESIRDLESAEREVDESEYMKTVVINLM